MKVDIFNIKNTKKIHKRRLAFESKSVNRRIFNKNIRIIVRNLQFY